MLQKIKKIILKIKTAKNVKILAINFDMEFLFVKNFLYWCLYEIEK